MHEVYGLIHQKRTVKAMAIQAAAIQGLFLSPILAHFQKTPNILCIQNITWLSQENER